MRTSFPLRPIAGWLGLSLIFAACLYDAEDRCSATQVFDGKFCVCPANHVPSGVDRCVPCGANQRAQGGTCECIPGFMRAGAGMACVAAPGLGQACAPPAEPCPAGAFTHCQPATNGGYCTRSGCASDAECPAGWACRTGTPSYCARPPVGQGKMCASADDCAGTEATFCETRQLKQCLVEGCSVAMKNCSPGYSCCDFTALGGGTLCLPLPQCP